LRQYTNSQEEGEESTVNEEASIWPHIKFVKCPTSLEVVGKKWAYLIDKNAIKEVDFSNPFAVRKEMVQNPEESLWIRGSEPEDIFLLQGTFGLRPLSVEAATHQNQPSKIEEYDE
jgi:hypothetical protein